MFVGERLLMKNAPLVVSTRAGTRFLGPDHKDQGVKIQVDGVCRAHGRDTEKFSSKASLERFGGWKEESYPQAQMP